MKVLAAAAVSAALAAAVPSSASMAEHQAVLVAGSNTYGNYRHQADVCHAYQLLVKNGMPKENIITLFYDDIAHNEENPFPGKILYVGWRERERERSEIREGRGRRETHSLSTQRSLRDSNKPTGPGEPGKDVYAGCVPDYSGNNVKPETFLAVLTGNATSLPCKDGEGDATSSAACTGRVLQAKSDSDVFVNFADHGAPGLIAFPQTGWRSSVLKSKDLFAAMQTMNEKKMYRNLVFYLEACESGSMFEDYDDELKKMNVFATTAANGEESSWGTYCSPVDRVDDKSLGTCLGVSGAPLSICTILYLSA